MISQTSLNAVYPLVDQVNAGGVRLGADGNSILGALVAAADTPLTEVYGDAIGWEKHWLESLQADPIFGKHEAVILDTDDGQVVHVPVSVHNETMHKAVNLVADSVIRALGFARNVVKPLVSDVISKVEHSLEVAQTVVEPYEIVPLYNSAIWQSGIVLNTLSRFKHYQKPVSVARNEIPQIAMPENLAAEYLVTGSAELDALIQMTLKDRNLTPGMIWTSLFLSTDPIGGYRAQYWNDLDLMLLQFLMCNVLADKPIPNSGMSLTDWETLMTRLSVATGSACVAALGQQADDLASKRLLMGYQSNTGTIYLNGVMYDKFIDAGGTPELIYGAIMQGDIVGLQFDNLLAKAADYQAAWARFHTAKRFKQDSEYLARMRDALYTVICGEIQEIDPALLHPTANKSAMMDEAKKHISKISHYQTAELGQICLTLVAHILFKHTPALYILTRISELCDKNYTGEEAATLTVVEYITDWVASSVTIAK